MAAVRIRVDDLERGDVPALSVKTGRPCTNPVAIVLRPEQRLFSPLGPKFTAVVPLEARRVRERVLSTRAGWVLLVAGAAALLAAFTGAGSAVDLLSIVALVLYGVLYVLGDLRWIAARGAVRDGEILVTRVHADFARAVDEQYGREPSD